VIELLVSERCTRCNACVEACPTNVFDAVAGQVPRIARHLDCQTCYMCELYCPTDALFVGSDAERPHPVDEAQIVASGLLGQFRRDHGWGEWANDPRYENQHWYMGEVFRRARAEAAVAEPSLPPRPKADE
jgi:NAD-dependent dihydropyrimidine dehydrogenase PreA subunit